MTLSCLFVLALTSMDTQSANHLSFRRGSLLAEQALGECCGKGDFDE